MSCTSYNIAIIVIVESLTSKQITPRININTNKEYNAMHTIYDPDMAVAEKLKGLHVKYGFHYLGDNFNTEDSFRGDKWQVTFTNYRGHVENFEYTTGSGHRVSLDPRKSIHTWPTTIIRHWSRLKELLGSEGRVWFDCRSVVQPNSVRVLADVVKSQRAVAPTQASVLYCLLGDSDVLDYTFADWCDGFGYDTDSREAFRTYELCQINADKLKKVFSGKEIETLRELLEDY